MSMYYGDNKSALLSQNLIADALIDLLQTGAFSEISISAVCKRAGVSRQTFYSLFGSKENVVKYELTKSCRYFPDDVRTVCEKRSLIDFCGSYADYIDKNRQVISLLVRNNMMNCLYEIQYKCFVECESFMGDVPGEERTAVVDFIVSGLNVLARNYVLSEKMTQDELSRLMFRLFSGAYFE